MSASSAIPLPLQKGIDFVPFFIEFLSRARIGLIRCMRKERKEALKKFLTVLILSTSLQHDGAICYITDTTAKPKTLQELAAEAGISFAQAKRCLALLKDFGYIASKQIKRKNRINGEFEVSPALRVLTKKFWQKIGLWELYQESMAWAKKHCRRYFIMPFKAIKLAEKTLKQVGGLVGGVLKSMHKEAEQQAIKAETEGQKRAKFWCNKIINDLRQKQ